LEYLEGIRNQFPILKTTVGKYPLIYFDNGATSQKPQVVIDAITHYYAHENANIHRGVHHLSQLATEKYEWSRETIRKFLNAQHSHEIIFTSGTTGGINLVASSFGKLLAAGDEILISEMEHHSNIVPWQMLCESQNLTLEIF
jgi:cysteine desulfurase/selenocysteine lyase